MRETIISISTTKIEAGATGFINVKAPGTIRGRNLYIPDEGDSRDFTVSEVHVNRKKQDLTDRPPFDRRNKCPSWRTVLDIAGEGETIVLTVINETDRAREFKGAIICDMLTGPDDQFEEIEPEEPPIPPPAHSLQFEVGEIVPPDAAAVVRVRAPDTMVIRAITIPSEIANDFLIERFEVNGQPQFDAHGGAVPAVVFSDEAVEMDHFNIEVNKDDLIYMVVRNTSFRNEPRPFRGVVRYDAAA